MERHPRALLRLQRKLTVENLWLYVVKVLLDEKRSMRAYDIKVKIREKFGIDPPAVTVYTVIYRMGLDGLLTRERSEDGSRYKPTERGIEAFRTAIVFLEELVAKLKL